MTRSRNPLSWEAIGERVASARKSAGLTQEELAGRISIDRTALSKIESGRREIDVVELSRLATALERSVTWFLTTPSPALSSRRAALAHREPHRVDDLLEELAAGVELLLELELLSPKAFRFERPVATLRDAAQAAQAAREHVGAPDGPLWDLARVAEDLGLISVTRDVGDPRIDGCYAALATVGVAIVNGAPESGRRRFTLAHELGHHVLQDEYATDWAASTAPDERERLVNAFAIHFLVPREGLGRRWRDLDGASDPWLAALRLAAEFGVSWSAFCAQLANLNLVDQQGFAALVGEPPRRAAYLEHEVAIREDLVAPDVPPRYAAAVVRGYRSQHLGAHRAVELLFGKASEEDLPSLDRIPLESLRSDLEPLHRG